MISRAENIEVCRICRLNLTIFHGFFFARSPSTPISGVLTFFSGGSEQSWTIITNLEATHEHKRRLFYRWLTSMGRSNRRRVVSMGYLYFMIMACLNNYEIFPITTGWRINVISWKKSWNCQSGSFPDEHLPGRPRYKPISNKECCVNSLVG